MLPDSFHFPVIRFLNRVLSDYPAARVQLQRHQGKLIAAEVGPASTRTRITAAGEMELVGDTGDVASLPAPDVAITVPLSLLPRLARKDPTAVSQIIFTGDSELAATLADIARNIEWDVEADLSRVVGDVVAHRIVDTAHRANAWQLDTRKRLTANVAEYLTEERDAFIASRDLENLTRQNETLRDDIARLEARLGKLAARA